MNVDALIEGTVRRTMTLVARLATTAGSRAPLADISDRVFVDLVRELRGQGLAGKVIADMFGLALRSFQAKVRRLSDQQSSGRTVSMAVLDFVRREVRVSRAGLLHRFRRDDESMVRGVINDLVESGLIYRTGRGPATMYRIADEAADDGEPVEADAAVLWLMVHRRGPSTRDELADALMVERQAIDAEALDAALARLASDGRLVEVDGQWTAETVVIGPAAEDGRGAAMLDHFEAVVATLCDRLAVIDGAPEGAIEGGGSTYQFDVWPGHPLRAEVAGQLAELRARLGALRARVDAHNEGVERPVGVERVTVYCGQSMAERRSGPDG